MSLMLSVSGCRGIVGDTLTPEVAARFAGSFASWLRDRAVSKPVTIVFGRDGRAGGAMIRDAAAAGIAAAGCNGIDLDIAMTPTVAVMTDAYARREEGIVAGMVLTASHNPQQWNGLKCLLAEDGDFGSAACAPHAALAAQIIERFKSTGLTAVKWDSVGHITRDDSGVEEHVERVLAALRESGLCDEPETLGEGLRIAVDCVNASGSAGAQRLLEALGCEEILPLNISDSGLFPHPPEPTAENLALPGGLCDVVREAGADVGFAQDPDADRLALIDEQGRYIGEEYTLALSALALLQADDDTADPRTLITNLSTSRMLDDVAARHKATVQRTAVGEANVVEAMKAAHALAGGEGNGGIIWPRVTYVRDSLSAMALTIWLLAGPHREHKGRRRLSDIAASLPAYAIQKRKVDLARKEDAARAVDAIARAYAAQHIDRQDGAWVDFRAGPLAGKAWLHVRASNTEPIMRLISEAPTVAQANALLDEAAKAISTNS